MLFVCFKFEFFFLPFLKWFVNWRLIKVLSVSQFDRFVEWSEIHCLNIFFYGGFIHSDTLAASKTSLRSGSATTGMPFIDDTLLWCPDNDGRMVDISACLQVHKSTTRIAPRFPLSKMKTKIITEFWVKCFNSLQDATGVNVSNNQNQEIPGSSCDLSSLDPLCNDSEEILRQLVENPFDVDSFFTEFNGADVKVSIKYTLLTSTQNRMKRL